MRYDPCLHVVLHEPEIPPNTGNIGRTCVAIGAKLWLVRPLGFSLDDYYLRRAGLDYWEHLEWEAVNSWQDLLARLPREPTWLFSARSTRLYTSVEYRRGDVLVFGSETRGLPKNLLEANAEKALTIPSRPQVRSLNLSNAAAIVCYEAIRQWRCDVGP
jgi:tRNA (cytidine/uridine-2'-O-)-methyltransferase